MVDAEGKTYWKNLGQAPAAATKSKKVPAQNNQKPSNTAAPKAVLNPNTQLIEEKVLGFLNTNNVIQDSGEFSTSQNISKDELDPVLKSLTSENYIVLEVIETRFIELTDEGNNYA